MEAPGTASVDLVPPEHGMIFSKQFGFGAFALLFLERCTECRTKPLEESASDLGLSRALARRVLDALENAGLIARAARAGHYRLAKPLLSVHVGEVLDALEPPPRPVSCLENPNRLCQTFQELWSLHERIRDSLRHVTLTTFVQSTRNTQARSIEAQAAAAVTGAEPSRFRADGASAWVTRQRTICCDPIHAALHPTQPAATSLPPASVTAPAGDNAAPTASLAGS